MGDAAQGCAANKGTKGTRDVIGVDGRVQAGRDLVRFERNAPSTRRGSLAQVLPH